MIRKLADSRFEGLSLWTARLILLLLAAAMLASLIPASRTVQAPPARTEQDDSDLILYQAIVKRVQAGESYYSAATKEQRARNYPLRPFVTVRLPTLANLIAALGNWGAKALLLSIWAAAIFAWRARLLPHASSSASATAAALLLFASVGPIMSTHYLTMHEFWAGGLLTLSLGMYRPERWLPSVVAASLALMMREHVLPFVLLMMASALWHRRWPEARAWTVAVLGFALLIGAHMHFVTALTLASDKASPGWAEFAGISGALSYFYQGSWFRILPDLWSYPLIILSLFGWLSWRHPLGLMTSLLLLGYGLMFMMIGRANTFYWALIVGPLLGMGLIFLRIAIPDLVRTAWPRQLDLAAR